MSYGCTVLIYTDTCGFTRLAKVLIIISNYFQCHTQDFSKGMGDGRPENFKM